MRSATEIFTLFINQFQGNNWRETGKNYMLFFLEILLICNTALHCMDCSLVFVICGVFVEISNHVLNQQPVKYRLLRNVVILIYSLHKCSKLSPWFIQIDETYFVVGFEIKHTSMLWNFPLKKFRKFCCK